MLGKELDRYWKTVVNTISDGIMIVSTSGAIVAVNEAFEHITGYDRAELIGQPCTVMDCDVCKEALENGGDHWCFLFRTGSIRQRKCRIRKKDGAYIHALKKAALLRDDDGNPIGAVGTISDLSEIIEKDNQLEAFRRELRFADGFHGLIGTSQPMQQVYDLIENAAHSDAPVIIFGESGTGKELVSRAIHEIGERRDQPLVKVNCASLTESLLESELFGHVRGAYTGAYRDRVGRFEKAQGGAIFLDEIGDLPLSIQVKLLRTLETKRVERVGDHRPIAVDVRIITATNRNLEQLVAEGKFREDFFFRINVIPIHLPPLRERLEDIPALADHFIRHLRGKSGKEITGLSPDALELFMRHAWPGNVRELKGVLEYAFVVAEAGLIRAEHLPVKMKSPATSPEPPARPIPRQEATAERDALLKALIRCRGNQTQTAKLLGVNRVTVWHRIKKHGIDLRNLPASTG
jgi:PAS domain S-box-containing protein